MKLGVGAQLPIRFPFGPSPIPDKLSEVLRSMNMDVDDAQRRQWEAEFDAAARRPLRQRFRYAFIRTYKPVLDDVSYRAFDTMADYRAWCEANLPTWLGYGTREI